MRALRLLVVLLLVPLAVASPSAQAQDTDTTGLVPDTIAGNRSPVVQRVVRAFSEGDATRLLVPSADRVEISLFGARTHYSSAQALYVIRDFFRSHAPQRFRVEDVMETGSTCLVRGQYTQARVAQRLEIYVRLDLVDDGDAWELQEVNIGSVPERR